ncbi:MAG TPA: gas vesicle protein GvpO [Solirubrobacteraceae bacterium]|nr:gas vesicle protein GvpO [Solirubrobacteraceae bacterium]
MAEQRSSRSRNGSRGSSNGSRSDSGDGSGSRQRSRLNARDAVERVRDEFPAMLGRPVESVLGVERGDDGWQVTIQVVELARIPSTTDVLGAYVVELDEDGELVGYRRRRRYNRSQTDED